MDLTKIGFAVQMVLQDMNTTQAGTATVPTLCTTVVDGATVSIPCDAWANGAEAQWRASDTGMGVLAANDDETLNNSAGNWARAIWTTPWTTPPPLRSRLQHLVDDALGSVVFMGMGAPETVSDVLADPELHLNATRTAYGSLLQTPTRPSSAIGPSTVPSARRSRRSGRSRCKPDGQR